MPNDERILETMPTGTLGLVATDSCIGLAQKVDAYLIRAGESTESTSMLNESAFKDYYKNSLTLSNLLHLDSVPARLNGVINQSVRGYDLYHHGRCN